MKNKEDITANILVGFLVLALIALFTIAII
jgi:hypothetical protein